MYAIKTAIEDYSDIIAGIADKASSIPGTNPEEISRTREFAGQLKSKIGFGRKALLASALAAAIPAGYYGYKKYKEHYPDQATIDPLQKAAFIGGAIDSYDKWKEDNPVKSTIGSMLPVVGSGFSAANAASDFKNGRHWSGLFNTAMVPLGLLPFGGSIASGIASKVPGVIGRGAKAIASVAQPAQNVYHASGVAGQTALGIGQVAGGVGAQVADQKRLEGTPEYQSQMKEHENTMNDFNEWRQHKQTLQQLPKPTGFGQATPFGKTSAHAYPPVTDTLGSVARGLRYGALPAATVSMVKNIEPGFEHGDTTEMGHGAARSAGGLTGGSLGAMGGAALGHLSGNIMKGGRGTAYAATLLGALAGGMTGYHHGHRLAGRAVGDNYDQPKFASHNLLNLRKLKSE